MQTLKKLEKYKALFVPLKCFSYMLSKISRAFIHDCASQACRQGWGYLTPKEPKWSPG